MAECPDDTSVIDTTGEVLAAKAEDADLMDSYSRNYQKKIQANMNTSQTPAVSASSNRREQLIREALNGKCPGAYAELFQRSAPTAPSSLASHSRPHQGPSPIYPAGLGGPDEHSSSEESRASSGLSMRSSAGVLSAEIPARGSDVGSGLSIEPLEMSMLGQDRDTRGRIDSHLTPDAPRSERISPTLPSSPGRPGANTKQILPPIPSGRKTNDSGPKL